MKNVKIKNDVVYNNQNQEKLHKALKIILQAFNEDDTIFYKEKINHFYESPALRRHERKLYNENYKKDYSLKEFQSKCYLWLNTVFFDFTTDEIKAMLEAGKVMKRQMKNTDEYLLYVLSAQPKKYTEQSASFMPKRVQIKKKDEKEKIEFDFLADNYGEM